MQGRVPQVIRWMLLAVAQPVFAVVFFLFVSWTTRFLACAKSDTCGLLPDPGEDGYPSHMVIVLVFAFGIVLLNTRIAPRSASSVGVATGLAWGSLIAVALLENCSYAVAASIGAAAAFWIDRSRQ